jgi:hypothetical protein
MFSIFTRLENDEFIFVASRPQLGQAMQLAQELNASWPAELMAKQLRLWLAASMHPGIHGDGVFSDT